MATHEALTQLLTAIRARDLSMVTSLARSTTSINSVHLGLGHTPLTCAIENGDPDVVRTLLELGADPNLAPIDGQTPLHHAVDSSVQASIRALDMEGVDVPPSTKLVDILLDWGANPRAQDAHGATAFDWAVKMGHPGAARVLMEREAGR